MIDIENITAFFGWCTLINMAFYIFFALFIIGFEDFTIKFHSTVVGLNPTELPTLYFKFLGNYKIIIIAFNLAPYIALKLMS